MARKKVYIYHVLIGNNGVTEIDTFILARNSKVGEDFCRKTYTNKKYNTYKFIKVGISHENEETQILSADLAQRLRDNGYADGDFYREIE
jgi:hypothetical protein